MAARNLGARCVELVPNPFSTGFPLRAAWRENTKHACVVASVYFSSSICFQVYTYRQRFCKRKLVFSHQCNLLWFKCRSEIFPGKPMIAGTKLAWFTHETNMAESVRLQDTSWAARMIVLCKKVSSKVSLSINKNITYNCLSMVGNGHF